jgi:Gamma tubulin complex component C-terminal
MARQSMMHFVSSVKSYLMFDVLDGGWKRLVPDVEHAESLDQVIIAHDRYLAGISRKSLMRSNDGGEQVDDLDIPGKVESLLLLVNEFCRYQESLFDDALREVDRAAEKRREAELLAKRGGWGFDRQAEAAEQETCFGLSDTSKLQELDSLTREFNDQAHEFLRALDIKLNGRPAWDLPTASPATPTLGEDFLSGETQVDDQEDLDSLRFLAFQLDNNAYYGVTKF